jgi:hypothetical protein
MNAVYNTMAIVSCFRSVQNLERVHCGRTSANSATYTLHTTGQNGSLSSRTPLLIDRPLLLQTNGLACPVSGLPSFRPGLCWPTISAVSTFLSPERSVVVGPFGSSRNLTKSTEMFVQRLMAIIQSRSQCSRLLIYFFR